VKALLLATALVHGTVMTGDGPPQQDATVLFTESGIVAVGQDVPIPAAATVIDVTGSVVTPGLIDAASRLGVVDVSLETTAVEGTAGSAKETDPIRAALRTADTFNPASITVPVARQGGLTGAVVIPTGGTIAGQSSFVDLLGPDPFRRRTAALHVSIAGGKPAGARSRAFMLLREVFADTRLMRANRGPYVKRALRELSPSAAELDVLLRVLDRKLKVVFYVNRATDIETALELARDYRLDMVLAGAAEGWKLADRLAESEIPVLVDPLANLPGGFDSLEVRADNAYRLHAAGVSVSFTALREAHRAHRLRWLAGNAQVQGFTHDEALAAITRNPARAFGLRDVGVLRRGAAANVVVWNGDPLALDTWPTDMFIGGARVPLRSRQDQLTERYAAPRE
jgi:imidazolonepropionase-like amidohydrolase